MPNVLPSPLQGAIIGFGKVAEMAHVPALAMDERFQIAAVADPLYQRRARAQAVLPQARVYATAEELLAREPDLDFVDICTPPADHTALSLAALGRGCHVLCEKPLTLEPEDILALKAAASQADRTLVTVHNWKHAPLLARGRELAGSGAVGAIKTVEWEVHRTSGSGGGLTAWRQEEGQGLGGILIDHGWHAFYLLMGWVGEIPQALNARLVFKDDQAGVDQEAEVRLRFPSCQGRLFLTWQAGERRNWGRLRGNEGELVLADDRLILAGSGRPEEIQSFPDKVSAGSHHPHWMGGVLEELLTEIAHPHRRRANLREAELCALLIRLAYRSHRAGGAWLDVSPP
jgi:predicted dehydrogenase